MGRVWFITFAYDSAYCLSLTIIDTVIARNEVRMTKLVGRKRRAIQKLKVSTVAIAPVIQKAAIAFRDCFIFMLRIRDDNEVYWIAQNY